MNSEHNPNQTTQFLNFSDALNHLRWGERIARRTWKTGSYLKINYTPPRSRIELCVADVGRSMEWYNNCEALLAEDWYVLGAHQ